MKVQAPKITLTDSELRNGFDEIKSQCVEIVRTLGTGRRSKAMLCTLQIRAGTLGRSMQKLGRANLKTSGGGPLLDPGVPDDLTPDDFLRMLRRAAWEALGDLDHSREWEPNQRLAFLRRRFWSCGRRLELMSKACVVTRVSASAWSRIPPTSSP
jgi:hypothetical protein